MACEDGNPVLMLTNCDSNEEAELIADELLKQKLAAAVQVIGPICSRYRWQNDIHKKEEWMIMIKTSDACEEAITGTIKELHGYELPGILKLKIDGGEKHYLEWMISNSQEPIADRGGELG